MKGFFLPFMALVIVTLLSIIALAVDLGMWSAARNRAQLVLDRAALTGIEGWVRRQAGRQISELNFQVQQPVRGDIATILLDNQNLSEAELNFFWSFENPPPNTPVIISPGRRFRTRALLEASLGSDALAGFTCDETPGLFCALTSIPPNVNTIEQLGINALRIEGEPYTPLVNTFARFFGFGEMPVTVVSTAEVVPPELYFVVDITGTTTAETHFRENRTVTQGQNIINIQASDFVFSLCNQELRVPPPPPNEFPGFPVCTPTDPDGLRRGGRNEVWRNLAAVRPPNQPPDDRIHFKSDYTFNNPQFGVVQDPNVLNRRYQINPPIHRGFDGQNRRPDQIGFINDQYGDLLMVRDIDESPYVGPEPLRTILGAFETLIRRMNELIVAGNRVGVLFFDGPRVEGDPDPGQRGLVPVVGNLENRAPFGFSRIFRSVDSTEAMRVFVTDGLGLTGISNGFTQNHLQNLVTYGIFPSSNNISDMTWGLIQGYFELLRTREMGIRTNQRIIYIGDGLTNCDRSGRPGRSGTLRDLLISDWNFDNLGLAQILTENIVCNAISVDGYNRSINDIQLLGRFFGGESIPGQIVKPEIALDVILIGQEVAPNLVDARDNNNECLNQEEARRLRVPITSGDTHFVDNNNNITHSCRLSRGDNLCQAAYRDRSPQRPFRLPNQDLMTAAWFTGGDFYPIVQAGTPIPQCWQGEYGNRTEFPSVAAQLNRIMDRLLAANVSYQIVR